MKITNTTDYAIRVLIELADAENSSLSAMELSKQIGISDKMMRRVLYILCKNDLVFSTRGIKGGYCLARKPQDISIYDIMKATENSMVICPSIDNTPERWINRYYAKVQADIHQMLKSVTLFQVKQTAGDA